MTPPLDVHFAASAKLRDAVHVAVYGGASPQAPRWGTLHLSRRAYDALRRVLAPALARDGGSLSVSGSYHAHPSPRS